jgi:hypothetical protein
VDYPQETESIAEDMAIDHMWHRVVVDHTERLAADIGSSAASDRL